MFASALTQFEPVTIVRAVSRGKARRSSGFPDMPDEDDAMSDSGSAGGGKSGKASAEEEAALSERLRALGTKLDKAKAESQQQAKAEAAKSGGMQGVGFALRVASEFASASWSERASAGWSTGGWGRPLGE